MRRVALFLELVEDEAEQVIQAISRSEVRFGDLPLDNLLETARASVAKLTPGAAIVHTARSDGAIKAGEAAFDVVPRPSSKGQ